MEHDASLSGYGNATSTTADLRQNPPRQVPDASGRSYHEDHPPDNNNTAHHWTPSAFENTDRRAGYSIKRTFDDAGPPSFRTAGQTLGNWSGVASHFEDERPWDDEDIYVRGFDGAGQPVYDDTDRGSSERVHTRVQGVTCSRECEYIDRGSSQEDCSQAAPTKAVAVGARGEYYRTPKSLRDRMTKEAMQGVSNPRDCCQREVSSNIDQQQEKQPAAGCASTNLTCEKSSTEGRHRSCKTMERDGCIWGMAHASPASSNTAQAGHGKEWADENDDGIANGAFPRTLRSVSSGTDSTHGTVDAAHHREPSGHRRTGNIWATPVPHPASCTSPVISIGRGGDERGINAGTTRSPTLPPTPSATWNSCSESHRNDGFSTAPCCCWSSVARTEGLGTAEDRSIALTGATPSESRYTPTLISTLTPPSRRRAREGAAAVATRAETPHIPSKHAQQYFSGPSVDANDTAGTINGSWRGKDIRSTSEGKAVREGPGAAKVDKKHAGEQGPQRVEETMEGVDSEVRFWAKIPSIERNRRRFVNNDFTRKAVVPLLCHHPAFMFLGILYTPIFGGGGVQDPYDESSLMLLPAVTSTQTRLRAPALRRAQNSHLRLCHALLLSCADSKK